MRQYIGIRICIYPYIVCISHVYGVIIAQSNFSVVWRSNCYKSSQVDVQHYTARFAAQRRKDNAPRDLSAITGCHYRCTLAHQLRSRVVASAPRHINQVTYIFASAGTTITGRGYKCGLKLLYENPKDKLAVCAPSSPSLLPAPCAVRYPHSRWDSPILDTSIAFFRLSIQHASWNPRTAVMTSIGLLLSLKRFDRSGTEIPDSFAGKKRRKCEGKLVAAW